MSEFETLELTGESSEKRLQRFGNFNLNFVWD